MRRPTKPGKTVRRAKALRRDLSPAELKLWCELRRRPGSLKFRKSPAELKLWCELRRRPGSLKFRKQHPAGDYVLDFYCAAARLAIEIDGTFHDRGGAPARDAARDVWLARFGIVTLRVPALELYRDLVAVINGIVAAASARLPLHHPAAPDGPPPQAELGED